jgi:archaellum biogenesis ATPase FlaH
MTEVKTLDDYAADPFSMEKLIIQKIFKDENFRDTIIPYISNTVFSDPKAKDLFSKLEVFTNEFGEFPSLQDTKLKLTDESSLNYINDCFAPDIDVSNYNEKHLLSSVETYVKNNMFGNVLMDAMQYHDKPNFADLCTAFPERSRDILSFSFDTTVGMDVFSAEGLDRMSDYFHQTKKYVSTGISGLDEMVGGGFHAKTLSLFMLPTNKGKSAIMGAIATNMAMAGKNVLYITLEMSEEMIAKRIMANALDTEQDSLKDYAKSTLGKMYTTVAKNIQGRFYIKEYPTSTMNSNQIRRLLKELKDKKKWEPEAIFVDYLGLMKPNNVRAGGQKHEDLKTVAEELRDIGMEYDVPIVSAMQTNRSGYDSADLDLADMSESFGVAMTADVTIAGIMNEELKLINQYIWRIIKNRFGQNQQEINVGMNFAKMKLEDLGDMPRNIGEVGQLGNNPMPIGRPANAPSQQPSAAALVNQTKDDNEEHELNGSLGYTPAFTTSKPIPPSGGIKY